ncbi:transporter substrate-binding domain-containing protein [Rhodanobacter lindaniclasticus]
MRKHLWPLCLLFTLALVPGATTRAAGQTIKVYPIAAGTAATVAPATELQHANQPLLVGVAVAPPFVIEDHGHYRGLAIELWEAVAADHGWKYVYQPYALDGLLDAVRDSKVDVGLGAITATAAGAQHTDFSHPILSTGLGVAVRGGQAAGWLAVARALESPVFLTVATALVLLLLVAGSLLWLLEYRRRPEPSDSGRGLFSGIWWATATLTTVGGDAAPRTVGGRIVGLVRMLVALAIVAGLTATITSALTVGQLRRTRPPCRRSGRHAAGQRARQRRRRLAATAAPRLPTGARCRCRTGRPGRRRRRRRGAGSAAAALGHPATVSGPTEGLATAAAAAGLCFRPARRQPPAPTDRRLAAQADQRPGLAATPRSGIRRRRAMMPAVATAGGFGRPDG